MFIDRAHYHGWQGRLLSPWLASLSIVRVALLQVFRRKSYWLVLLMGLGQFLVFWSMIYAVTQLNPPGDAKEAMLRAFGFSPVPPPPSSGSLMERQSGYIKFMDRQSVVVMILLAFSGSLLVGADFRKGSLSFYLSRRIDRRHYIVGKLLAVATIVSLMTTLPALVLFVEYGMFTSSAGYWLNNWRLPLAVLAYGAVLAFVLAVLLVSLSAWLQRTAPIAITWASLFVLPGRLREILEREIESPYWMLIDPWRDINLAGRLCFGGCESPFEYRLAYMASGLLFAACLIALVCLVRRVRAVEVVT